MGSFLGGGIFRIDCFLFGYMGFVELIGVIMERRIFSFCFFGEELGWRLDVMFRGVGAWFV